MLAKPVAGFVLLVILLFPALMGAGENSAAKDVARAASHPEVVLRDEAGPSTREPKTRRPTVRARRAAAATRTTR